MEKQAVLSMVVPVRVMSYVDVLRQIVTIPVITTLSIPYQSVDLRVSEDVNSELIQVKVESLVEGDRDAVVKNVQRALDYHRQIAGIVQAEVS